MNVDFFVKANIPLIGFGPGMVSFISKSRVSGGVNRLFYNKYFNRINHFLDCEIGLFNFEKKEAIDLTQNFCNWIYDNDFTSLKLSIISKNIID